MENRGPPPLVRLLPRSGDAGTDKRSTASSDVHRDVRARIDAARGRAAPSSTLQRAGRGEPTRVDPVAQLLRQTQLLQERGSTGVLAAAGDISSHDRRRASSNGSSAPAGRRHTLLLAQARAASDAASQSASDRLATNGYYVAKGKRSAAELEAAEAADSQTLPSDALHRSDHGRSAAASMSEARAKYSGAPSEQRTLTQGQSQGRPTRDEPLSEPVWLGHSDPRRRAWAAVYGDGASVPGDVDLVINAPHDGGDDVSVDAHMHLVQASQVLACRPEHTHEDGPGLVLVPSPAQLAAALERASEDEVPVLDIAELPHDVWGVPVEVGQRVTLSNGRRFIVEHGARVLIHAQAWVAAGKLQDVELRSCPHLDGEHRGCVRVHALRLGDLDVRRLARSLIGPPLAFPGRDTAAPADAEHDSTWIAYQKYWAQGAVLPLPAHSALVAHQRALSEVPLRDGVQFAAETCVGNGGARIVVRDGDALYKPPVTHVLRDVDGQPELWLPAISAAMQRMRPPPHCPFVSVPEWFRLQAAAASAAQATQSTVSNGGPRPHADKGKAARPTKPQIVFCNVCHANADVMEHCYDSPAHAQRVLEQVQDLREVNVLQRLLFASPDSGGTDGAGTAGSAALLQPPDFRRDPFYADAACSSLRNSAPQAVPAVLVTPHVVMGVDVTQEEFPLVYAAALWRDAPAARAHLPALRSFVGEYPLPVQERAVIAVQRSSEHSNVETRPVSSKAQPWHSSTGIHVPIRLTLGALRNLYRRADAPDALAVHVSSMVPAITLPEGLAEATDAVLFPRDEAGQINGKFAAAAVRALSWMVCDAPAARCVHGWPQLAGSPCTAPSPSVLPANSSSFKLWRAPVTAQHAAVDADLAERHERTPARAHRYAVGQDAVRMTTPPLRDESARKNAHPPPTPHVQSMSAAPASVLPFSAEPADDVDAGVTTASMHAKQRTPTASARKRARRHAEELTGSTPADGTPFIDGADAGDQPMGSRDEAFIATVCHAVGNDVLQQLQLTAGEVRLLRKMWRQRPTVTSAGEPQMQAFVNDVVAAILTRRS